MFNLHGMPRVPAHLTVIICPITMKFDSKLRDCDLIFTQFLHAGPIGREFLGESVEFGIHRQFDSKKQQHLERERRRRRLFSWQSTPRHGQGSLQPRA